MNIFYKYFGYACSILLVAFSACTISNTEAVGEQDTILDTDWVLLSFGDETVPVLQETRNSFIHFSEGDNKMNGFAGCNKFFGRYELKGNRLKISDLGSTRMSCPDMEAERYLLGVLENVTTYSISGNVLTLFSGNNAIATFQTNPGPTRIQEEMLDQR
ncbi:META domain-containing protein [Pontibacter sp. SGAir0037]|uniref:META domain-containing protein n=1 Tax=Pontibacter sp. SGAir0037 TaxID=2571030 RepID=UPI0010CD63D3|nr:META domain-containing protein [Pontibacter sp. SGAir0037]QCR21294.1 hypothetical protein C1N53_02305 [Pontibacter sp. SGAir0037]